MIKKRFNQNKILENKKYCTFAFPENAIKNKLKIFDYKNNKEPFVHIRPYSTFIIFTMCPTQFGGR